MKKPGRTKWQQTQIDKGCCVVCGKKAVAKVLTLCNKHRKERTKRALKRYYENKEK